MLITKVSANPSTETEIYQWLNQQANRSGAIKTLIEREIAGKETELSANHKLLACMQWHITQHQEQFGLFFVEYSSHMRREDLFTALEGTYASSIITVDYSAFKGSQQTYLDEWLHEILTKKRLHQNVVAINLVGVENLLLLGEARVLSAAEKINSRTEYFKELNVPLFFWTTNQARLEVLKYASDFYSLHNDVLIVD